MKNIDLLTKQLAFGIVIILLITCFISCTADDIINSSEFFIDHNENRDFVSGDDGIGA